MSTTTRVDLGERSYEIITGAGVMGELGDRCKRLGFAGRGMLVSDSNVAPLYAQACVDSLQGAGLEVELVTVPAGETSKAQEQVTHLYDKALSSGLDRSSFVVALGGGVVGDLAGYAAATYLRGIKYVQVPTTIVAIVDSAVGGKTGINLPQGKNLVGAFHQPSLVLADLDTLETLPEREYRAGMAEVVKYGVIRDSQLFETVEQHVEALLQGSSEVLEQVAARCCEIKADVVHEDEREGGVRAILNFGHTLGHAIENVAGYGTYLHGEAIAIGMVFAGLLSMKVKGFSDSDHARMVALLDALKLPAAAPELAWADLRKAIGSDKKTIGSLPKLVLAEHLGSVCIGCEVEESLLETIWNQLT